MQPDLRPIPGMVYPRSNLTSLSVPALEDFCNELGGDWTQGLALSRPHVRAVR